MKNALKSKIQLNKRIFSLKNGTVKRGWKFPIWNLDFSIKALSPYTCH
jgi:hypothetical protein